MLLSFETENYKSFKDKTVFSLVPAPKQKGLDYSILHEKIGKADYKALSTAVIYGANAAGKTNLIGAMQTFRSIVQHGNIRNCTTPAADPSDCFLELIPNSTLKESKPVSFSITFIHNNFHIKYTLSIDFGVFLEKSHARSILSEILEINGKVIYTRTKNELEIDNLDSIENLLIQDLLKNKNAVIEVAKNSLKGNSEDLFLTNGFKTIISQSFATLIINYVNSNLVTFYHADNIEYKPEYKERVVNFPKEFNDAIQNFGITSNKLVFIKNEKTASSVLCSVFNNKKIVPSDFYESYGTLRFVTIFPLLVSALKEGTTLVIDEFDASIHPMAIMNILNIFHNNEININHAQLIFNTHNPLYLNGNLLRRDEIKFVERDDDTKCSRQYSLSDFGTKGTNARKGKDYMKNYFINEYGAIRDIDLSTVFEKAVKG